MVLVILVRLFVFAFLKINIGSKHVAIEVVPKAVQRTLMTASGIPRKKHFQYQCWLCFLFAYFVLHKFSKSQGFHKKFTSMEECIF